MIELKNKTISETAVEELNRLFSGKEFYQENINGKIIKIKTDDINIINWARNKGLS